MRNAEYRELLDQSDATDDINDNRNIQLQRQRRIRQENVLEAQIQPNDTLQAIALRYNCTVRMKKKLFGGFYVQSADAAAFCWSDQQSQ